MWKYISKDQINQFLFSLHLLDINDEKLYIKKLYSISNNIEENYKVFKIKKSNGKFRTIYEPSDTLKHIQKVILCNILDNKKVSDYAKAYHKGLSLRDNAYVHVRKKIILKLDIKDFFESIDFYHVLNSCFSIEYFPNAIGNILTYICTYKGYLPQGAPTSAYISNLVMKDFDFKIGNFSKTRGIDYTRYSDDMTFSGDFDVSEVISKVKTELFKLGLFLNNNKIRVVKNSQRQIVTGIVVNKKLSVSKNKRQDIRQEIYYIKKFGLKSHLERIHFLDSDLSYLKRLYGKILFVLQINRDDQEFKSYKNYVRELLFSCIR